MNDEFLQIREPLNSSEKLHNFTALRSLYWIQHFKFHKFDQISLKNMYVTCLVHNMFIYSRKS